MQFRRHLAQRTGRTLAEIDDEWDRGGFVDAAGAIALGYADEVSA